MFLAALESHLKALLAQCKPSPERLAFDEQLLARVLAVRDELESKLEQTVLLDRELCREQELEDRLWRSAFYELIEPLRAAICELNAQSNAVATPHYRSYNEAAQRLVQTLQMICEKVYLFAHTCIILYTKFNYILVRAPNEIQ